eukprot:m.108449 g.108449  ORF g.108449 m.108449 type:complete len:234 (-) comp10659_c0_seq3:2883-3584(-)
MPTQGSFSVELEVDQGSGPCTLNEVTDTVTGRVYAVSRAGDEYKVKMTGPGTKHVGAIIQVDGIPHRDDFRKTPFTYFKKPYSDPGFWVDPAKGKVKSRVFGCPDQVESDAAGAATASTADDIGVIRVFFFDVHRLNEEVALDRRYVAPDAPKIQEGKKWYLASNNTRYGVTCFRLATSVFAYTYMRQSFVGMVSPKNTCSHDGALQICIGKESCESGLQISNYRPITPSGCH